MTHSQSEPGGTSALGESDEAYPDQPVPRHGVTPVVLLILQALMYVAWVYGVSFWVEASHSKSASMGLGWILVFIWPLVLLALAVSLAVSIAATVLNWQGASRTNAPGSVALAVTSTALLLTAFFVPSAVAMLNPAPEESSRRVVPASPRILDALGTVPSLAGYEMSSCSLEADTYSPGGACSQPVTMTDLDAPLEGWRADYRAAERERIRALEALQSASLHGHLAGTVDLEAPTRSFSPESLKAISGTDDVGRRAVARALKASEDLEGVQGELSASLLAFGRESALDLGAHGISVEDSDVVLIDSDKVGVRVDFRLAAAAAHCSISYLLAPHSGEPRRPLLGDTFEYEPPGQLVSTISCQPDSSS